MPRNDFRLAAERAEAAAFSPDGWLAMGQRGRSTAIYHELRQIDARTVEQIAREIEIARRHVREGEERIARQQVLMEKTESARYLGDVTQGTKLLNSMRFTLDLARHHLQRLESGGWIRSATASESRVGPPGGILNKHDRSVARSLC
jgi:hypothetical protein